MASVSSALSYWPPRSRICASSRRTSAVSRRRCLWEISVRSLATSSRACWWPGSSPRMREASSSASSKRPSPAASSARRIRTSVRSWRCVRSTSASVASLSARASACSGSSSRSSVSRDSASVFSPLASRRRDRAKELHNHSAPLSLFLFDARRISRLLRHQSERLLELFDERLEAREPWLVFEELLRSRQGELELTPGAECLDFRHPRLQRLEALQQGEEHARTVAGGFRSPS